MVATLATFNFTKCVWLAYTSVSKFSAHNESVVCFDEVLAVSTIVSIAKSEHLIQKFPASHPSWGTPDLVK